MLPNGAKTVLKPISIHAPAKGATCGMIKTTLEHTISIHAPAKGATVHSSHGNYFASYFNPRSREGSDLNGKTNIVEHTISIHAPAKGATERALETNLTGDISIHAPAKGATQMRL